MGAIPEKGVYNYEEKNETINCPVNDHGNGNGNGRDSICGR